jgi:hypothetical protein
VIDPYTPVVYSTNLPLLKCTLAQSDRGEEIYYTSTRKKKGKISVYCIITMNENGDNY